MKNEIQKIDYKRKITIQYLESTNTQVTFLSKTKKNRPLH